MEIDQESFKMSVYVISIWFLKSFLCKYFENEGYSCIWAKSTRSAHNRSEMSRNNVKDFIWLYLNMRKSGHYSWAGTCKKRINKNKNGARKGGQKCGINHFYNDCSVKTNCTLSQRIYEPKRTKISMMTWNKAQIYISK